MTCPDVGQSFYDYFTNQKCIVDLLKGKTDENGTRIVHFHRNRSPEFDSYLVQASETGTCEWVHPDFVVYRLADEVYEDCLGPGDSYPETVIFDVQIVSECLDKALKIKRAFERVVAKLNGECETDPCNAILPHEMCGMFVGEIRVTGASESHEPITPAREWGFEVFDLDVEITPNWSLSHANN